MWWEIGIWLIWRCSVMIFSGAVSWHAQLYQNMSYLTRHFLKCTGYIQNPTIRPSFNGCALIQSCWLWCLTLHTWWSRQEFLKNRASICLPPGTVPGELIPEFLPWPGPSVFPLPVAVIAYALNNTLSILDNSPYYRVVNICTLYSVYHRWMLHCYHLG